jgi:hypothetical protein
MTTQSTFERSWLAYARRVLVERTECDCDDDIQWPGYLGAKYAEGRLLLVGAIHNAPVLEASGLSSIATFARTWAFTEPNDEGDETYLKTVRGAYLAAIPQWKQWHNDNGHLVTGTVWTNFKKIVDRLELSFEHVAFTNLAKCALPAGTKPSVEFQRIRRHESVTSISSLIAMLKPRLVIIAKDSRTVNRLVNVSSSLSRIRRCNNRTFVCDGLPISEWLPREAARWGERLPTQ